MIRTPRIRERFARRGLWVGRDRAKALTIVAVTSILLLGPVLLGRGSYFGDWSNHLFVIDQSRAAIASTGLPTYVLNTAGTGLLYPFMLFYGGSLYALGGYLSVLTGSSEIVYRALWLLGFVAAFGGTYWCGRLAGLRRTVACWPALILVSSAYWLTNLYGRGALPEFVATSFVPLLIAGSVATVIARAARMRHLAAAGLAAFMITASHNITMVWTALTCVILLLAFGLAYRRRGLSGVGWRRPVLLAGVLGTAVAVNAWFLLPDLLWARYTPIVGTTDWIDSDLTGFFNSIEVVLSPWRFVPIESSTPELFVQFPVLAAAVAVTSTCALWKRADPAARAIAASGGGLCALSLALIFLPPAIWSAMPAVLKTVQFQYRLQFYATFGVALVVIAALRVVRRETWNFGSETGSPAEAKNSSRLASTVTAMIVIAGIVGLFQGALQAWGAATYGRVLATDLAPGSLPTTWHAYHDYRMNEAAPIAGAESLPMLALAPLREGALYAPQASSPSIYRTGVASSPLLQGVGGLEVLGRSADNLAVVRATKVVGASSDPVLVVVAPPAVLVGRLISMLAALLILAALCLRRVVLRWANIPHQKP